MNYRHIYHAGNFADVFKHWIYSLLLDYIQKKDKPYAVIDTHAGLGLYNLDATEANKTNEYQTGLVKLLDAKHIPDSFQLYLDIIKALNKNQSNLYYPGSPYLIKQFLRTSDKLHACELHPDDYQSFKRRFFNDSNIHCHNMNGYQTAKSLLPLSEKRGLILIDPPFENDNEFEQILLYLKKAITRFRQGTYAIWYPIKNDKLIQAFYDKLQLLTIDNLLIVELVINDFKNIKRLNGCGMIIINPTWQLDTRLLSDLPFLCDLFRLSPAGYTKVW